MNLLHSFHIFISIHFTGYERKRLPTGHKERALMVPVASRTRLIFGYVISRDGN